MSMFRRRLMIANNLLKKWDYEIYNVFFNGENAIDTGIKLYEDLTKDYEFELVFQQDENYDSLANDTCVLSCQNTSRNPYRGINIAIGGFAGISDEYYINLLGEPRIKIHLGKNEVISVNIKKYKGSIFINDVEYKEYDEEILERKLSLGANVDPNGNFYRYWNGTIYSFKFRWL